jgi:hypothetical protein
VKASSVRRFGTGETATLDLILSTKMELINEMGLRKILREINHTSDFLIAKVIRRHMCSGDMGNLTSNS